MSNIYVVSAVRTAVGAFGGALKDVAPSDLAAKVAAEAVARAALDPTLVGHCVFGQVIQTEPRDAYLARWAAITAGASVETPAMSVNRLCGSGLQAIISAAQILAQGEASIAIGGGAESMSRAPYLSATTRFGAKMGDTTLIDGLTGVLTDPFHRYHMGMTAENVAEAHGIARKAQDDAAYESHLRASRATREGRFESQILPVEVRAKGKTVRFDKDEHIRHDATREEFDGLRPAFKRDGGTVTAGNASGVNDGAAAVVLATEEAVHTHGLKPMARLVGWAHAGVDPALMGLGPIPATRKVLERTGLTLDAMDVIECNEAFAAQACAVARELGFDPAKLNPNGSGISIGHPIGATGAINTTKAIYELQRTGGRYGLVTMCIGGGQGIAMILERVLGPG